MKKYFNKLYMDGETEFYNEIETDLKDEKRKFIVTANPETFMIGERDPEMEKLLQMGSELLKQPKCYITVSVSV